jgi:glutaminyl-peptide cyclotransferase
MTSYPVIKRWLFLAPAITALLVWSLAARLGACVPRVSLPSTSLRDGEQSRTVGALSEARDGHATMQAAATRAAETGSLAFNGERAFEDLKRLVAFGPRPPGSKALAESRAWIISQLKQAGCQVEEDSFVASTPMGNVPMTNVIARIPGERPSIVMVAGHYDTLRVTGFRFVGANDGGSSAAFLVELARVLGRRKNPVTYWLVFFDGEEALEQWSETDSRYGSRHLVQKLASAGELSQVQAMILVDLIADTKLDIYRDSYSTGWLSDMIFANARRLGYSKYFIDSPPDSIEDDHIPFVNAGVSSVDVIDLDYGPGNSYWHTAQDTIDKCSALSFTIVGRVVTATLEELERSPHIK